MMGQKIKKFFSYSLWGIVIGLLNGLFGSGGGVAAVLVLKKAFGLETHKTHASAIMVIAPLSAASLLFYLQKGSFPWNLSLWVSLGGVAGGILGARLLAKLSSRTISRMFAIAMIAAAVRMVMS